MLRVYIRLHLKTSEGIETTEISIKAKNVSFYRFHMYRCQISNQAIVPLSVQTADVTPASYWPGAGLGFLLVFVQPIRARLDLGSRGAAAASVEKTHKKWLVFNSCKTIQ